MKKTRRCVISVLGAGNMGTALAQILAENGRNVCLWDYNPATIQAIKLKKENRQFLPGVKLSSNIIAEENLQTALSGAQIIIVAVASPFIRTVVKKLNSLLFPRRGRIIIAHVAKGLEAGTFLTMHEVIQSELKAALRKNVVTVTGPSIAKEFVCRVPTAVVALSQSKKARESIKKILESRVFKVATSDDFRGAGFCGAVKNVYAIALGMCDGIRLAMNAKAFLFTLALREMERLVLAFGGKRETVYGLAGVGDLLTTGLGEGRNRALGERICEEGGCAFIFREKNAFALEGVAAARSLFQFVKNKKIKAPIAEVIYNVVHKGAEPCSEIENFFTKAKFP